MGRPAEDCAERREKGREGAEGACGPTARSPSHPRKAEKRHQDRRGPTKPRTGGTVDDRRQPDGTGHPDQDTPSADDPPATPRSPIPHPGAAPASPSSRVAAAHASDSPSYWKPVWPAMSPNPHGQPRTLTSGRAPPFGDREANRGNG